MAQISQSEAADLLSKLLSERIPLVAFFRSPVAESRISGFMDSVTRSNGLTVSVSGPPIDVDRGYINVRPFERECEFWYGDKRELPEGMRGFSDEYGDSVLAIRFLDSGDWLGLFFTL